MECTQRLECTQDVYDNAERKCPEQIGFLGICGSKHPVKKGPNKIGRDPQTCSIVLNDNSISRQHAVINILNKNDFMLMDLDSANKTKLLNTTLQPYIPQPLKNGDTVQFGQLFGIFRLLEEDDDLPMTQALEIPETPVCIRNATRSKLAPITTIPESPDVSDRDDSIIVQSPKKRTCYKSPNNNFIKSSRKINEAKQIGTNKINNVYWTSSKKSDSFSSNFEGNSSYMTTRSSKSPKKTALESSIYDMETQVPGPPANDEISHSIYEAETQVPSNRVSPKLPVVFKVRDQSNVQLQLYSTNDKFNIFEAETQVTSLDKENDVRPALSKVGSKKKDVISSNIQKTLNSSDEEISFKEIDCQQFEEELGSQPLLPPDLDGLITSDTNKEKQVENNIDKNKIENCPVLNNSETKDSEKIAPSQVILDDEDVTDCEDEIVNQPSNIDDDETDCEDDLNIVNVNCNKKMADDVDDLTDCEDDVIEISQNRSKTSTHEGFHDLPTQVLREEPAGEEKKHDEPDVPFEEMLTQVIEEEPVERNNIIHEENDTNKSIPFEDLQTQVIGNEISQEQSNFTATAKQIENCNEFKRPLSSPKITKKDTALKSTKSAKPLPKINIKNKYEDEDNYYAATQEILDELCTQREQTDNLVSNMTKEQVREVIGVDVSVSPLTKKKSSDSSDYEVTPKKFNISKFLMIDLPNSQDIESCDFITTKGNDSNFSDGLEADESNEHSLQKNPHKRIRKKDVKVDLMKKFDTNNVPTRALTRIRKPTSKVLNSDRSTKKMSERILQSNLGLNNEHKIYEEIAELKLKRILSNKEKLEKKPSRKSVKNEKEVLTKDVEEERKVRNSDKKELKEHTIQQKTEKGLQQLTIKSLFTAETKNVKNETVDRTSNESRRSSRNKSKGDKKEVTETKVKEKETNKESSERKRSSTRVHSNRKSEKESIELIDEQETVVRRSARHQSSIDKKEKTRKHKESEKSEKPKTPNINHQNRSSKDKIEDKKEKKLIKTRKHKESKTSEKVSLEKNEISTVYNLSSETGVDSPNLKRQASSDIFASNTKRAKTTNASNTSGRTTSLRGVKTQYVLFTAFPYEEVKQKLEKLGAIIVSDVKKCTVVLTLQIKRTFKLLCAMGLGKPIVGPNWVQACADSNMIVDPWLYLIKDEATEKRFGFNLRQSLTCKRNFLKGYHISCTPRVLPNPLEMKSIVECSGGTWKEARGGVCVTCAADSALWPELRKRGAVLVTTEFILSGVLQQRINLDRDKLD